jgi:hypothetical protein
MRTKRIWGLCVLYGLRTSNAYYAATYIAQYVVETEYLNVTTLI